MCCFCLLYVKASILICSMKWQQMKSLCLTLNFFFFFFQSYLKEPTESFILQVSHIIFFLVKDGQSKLHWTFYPLP